MFNYARLYLLLQWVTVYLIAFVRWTWTYCRWGRGRGMPNPYFVFQLAVQTCSTLALTNRRQTVLHTKHKKWCHYKCIVLNNLVFFSRTRVKQDYQNYHLAFRCKIPNKGHMDEGPTIELHGDLSPLLVVHDRIRVIVRLPDHYLSVQLWTSSLWTQQRARLDKQMMHCTLVDQSCLIS